MLHFLKIKEKLLVAEVFLKEDAEAEIRCIPFSRQGKQLSYEAAAGGIYTMKEFLAFLKKRQAVVVIFTGKGVMTKQIPLQINSDDAALFNSVLPNSRSDEFWYSVHRGQQTCWISLVRKSAVEPVLSSLRAKGIFVPGIYCGPQVCAYIIKHLSGIDDTLIAGNYQVSIREGEPASILQTEAVPGTTSFGRDPINNLLLIALAGGFHYFTAYYSGAGGNSGIEEKSDAADHRLLNRIRYYSKIFSIAIFLVLLANFIVLDHYNREAGRLSTLVSAFSSQLAQSDSLEAEFNRKKEFLESAGLTGASNISMTADRLASELPDALSLESLDIFPVMMDEGKDGDFSTEKNMVRLCGKTPDAIVLNEWIRCVAAYPWIKTVNIRNYSKMPEHSYSRFELEIKLTSP